MIDRGHIKLHHASISVTFILLFRNDFLSPTDGHEGMMILEVWRSIRSDEKMGICDLEWLWRRVSTRKTVFSLSDQWLLPAPDMIPSSIWHFYQPISFWSFPLSPPPPSSSAQSPFLAVFTSYPHAVKTMTWRGWLGWEVGYLRHKTKLYQQEKETS